MGKIHKFPHNLNLKLKKKKNFNRDFPGISSSQNSSLEFEFRNQKSQSLTGISPFPSQMQNFNRDLKSYALKFFHNPH